MKCECLAVRMKNVCFSLFILFQMRKMKTFLENVEDYHSDIWNGHKIASKCEKWEQHKKLNRKKKKKNYNYETRLVISREEKKKKIWKWKLPRKKKNALRAEIKVAKFIRPPDERWI